MTVDELRPAFEAGGIGGFRSFVGSGIGADAPLQRANYTKSAEIGCASLAENGANKST